MFPLLLALLAFFGTVLPDEYHLELGAQPSTIPPFIEGLMVSSFSGCEAVLQSDIADRFTQVPFNHAYLSRLRSLLIDTMVCKSLSMSIEQSPAGLIIKALPHEICRLKAIIVKSPFFGSQTIKERYGIARGDPFDQKKHGGGLAAIERFFKQQGYKSVVVSSEIIKKQHNVVVRLKVTKGPLFRIRTITVEQRSGHEESKDLEALLNNFIQHLSASYNKKPWTDQIEQRLCSSIEHMLAQAGWFCIEVKVSASLDPKSTYTDLLCEVDWSKAVRIELDGLSNEQRHLLMKRIEQMPQWRLSPLMLEQQLKAWVQKNGFSCEQPILHKSSHCWRYQFILADKTPETTAHEDLKKTAVKAPKIMSAANAASRITTVVLDAPDLTFVPLRNFLTTNLLSKTQAQAQNMVRDLYDTGVFKSVVLHPLQDGNTDAAILRTRMTEPYELRLRFGIDELGNTIGFEMAAAYKAGGSLVRKNLFGLADQHRFDVDLSPSYYRIGGSSRFPIWQPLWSSIVIDFFDMRYRQSLFWNVKEELVKHAHSGCSIRLESNALPIRIGFQVGAEYLLFHDVIPYRAQQILFHPQFLNTSLPFGHIELQLEYGTKDNNLPSFLRTAGSLNARIMQPLSSQGAPLIRLLIEQSGLMRLDDAWGLRVRLRGGICLSPSFEQLLPTERFFLGGPDTVRSFAPNAAPPIIADIFEEGGVAPVGGDRFGLINCELHHLLTDQWRVVLFQDFGALSIQNIHTAVLQATGIGLRYLTPLGAFKFDFGIKPQILYPTDRRFAWFVSFGQAF